MVEEVHHVEEEAVLPQEVAVEASPEEAVVASLEVVAVSLPEVERGVVREEDFPEVDVK